MAVRGEIPRHGNAADDAEKMLDRLLDEGDARLATAWMGIAPQLRNVFPPLAWRRKRRLVLDLAEKYLSGVVPQASKSGVGSTRDARDLPADGRWAEVRIEAPPLRLRGRADLIERHAGDVVIRDLKSGRVVTSDGEILPHIERQMRLYGAMAHIVWPSARVALVVDHGVEREIEFTREHETEVLSWLESVLDRLPSDGEVDAALLARPGEACEGCAHRHVCPAYRVSAPAHWTRESRTRSPLDTWGTVAAIIPRGGDLADVTLVDAAGRTVKVFGIAMFRLRGVQSGDELWLFGLRTRDKRGGPELWRHPRNFFEVADDDPYARAWTVQSFVAP